MNLRYGYQALNEVFRLLFGIRKELGEEVYHAAREAVIAETADFAAALERTDIEIDPNYWVRGIFDPAMGNAFTWAGRNTFTHTLFPILGVLLARWVPILKFFLGWGAN